MVNAAETRCPACRAALPSPPPAACGSCGNRLVAAVNTGAASHARWLLSALVQAGAAGMSFVTIFLISGATVVGSNETSDIGVLRTCQLITLAQVGALLGWLVATEAASAWRSRWRRVLPILAGLVHVGTAYFVWHWGYWSW